MTNADDPLPDLIRSLRSPLPDSRARAARSLGRLGWLAKDALPLLVSSLCDAEAGVREAAAQAIGQMGPEALPHLVRMLAHDDKYVRRNSVWAIGKLGQLAKSAIGDLCDTLRDIDPRTAAGAAQALGTMGTDASDAIPALTEAMRGTNIVLCRLAAKALSQIGRPALPALIAHLRHRDPFVRGEAALALGWMGPTAAAAVPSLIDTLRAAGRPVGVAQTVPAGLDSRTPATPVTAPQGNPAPDDLCRAYTAQALGRIGSAAIAATAVLAQAVDDPNEHVRQSARTALKQIQGS